MPYEPLLATLEVDRIPWIFNKAVLGLIIGPVILQLNQWKRRHIGQAKTQLVVEDPLRLAESEADFVRQIANIVSNIAVY